MPSLPPERTPLYNHPLPAIEQWLRELGASQGGSRSEIWDLGRPGWTARIELESEDLLVHWVGEGVDSTRRFPYGLCRADVEAAILAGP